MSDLVKQAENVSFDSICRPALVYFVIALIMSLATLFLSPSGSNLGNFVIHLISIILCTLILMGICAVFPALSWAFVIIFILLNLSAISALLATFFGVRVNTTGTKN